MWASAQEGQLGPSEDCFTGLIASQAYSSTEIKILNERIKVKLSEWFTIHTQWIEKHEWILLFIFYNFTLANDLKILHLKFWSIYFRTISSKNTWTK